MSSKKHIGKFEWNNISKIDWIPEPCFPAAVKALQDYQNCLERNSCSESRQRELCEHFLSGNSSGIESVYPEEADDFLLTVFRAAEHMKLTGEENRMIRQMIGNRETSGENDRRLKIVRNVFWSGERLDKRNIHLLESGGFRVERTRTGVHCWYAGKMFVSACTPSDYRGGRNMISRISRYIDIEHNYAA